MMVRAADRVTNSPAGTELFECPRGKLGTAIDCQPHWNAFFRHPFLQQADDLGRCGCAATGADCGPAREAVSVHQKVLARQLEEVRGSTLERAGRRRFDQEGLSGVGGKACCARRTATDHIANIVCDRWPVDHLLSSAQSAVLALMGGVQLVEDLLPELYGNHHA